MIGISQGDANGVGPEILLRTFVEGKLSEDFMVIGDFSVLEYCARYLGLGIPFHKMKDMEDINTNMFNVYDAGILSENDITIGVISKKTGYASLKYIETGTQLALQKHINALVTLPINKESIRYSEKDFSGHTGYIASLCNTSNYTMMLASDNFIVTHVSTHVSLLEAIGKVRKDRILDVIRLTDAALKKIGKPSRIAVAGLNPHAGENSAFGKEDLEEIAPAIVAAHKEGINAVGPIPADTVFYQANKGKFDGVVCM